MKKSEDLLKAVLELATVLARQPDPTETTPEPWISVREAAAHASVSTDTIRSMLDGGLPHGRVGREYRIRRSAIDTWMVQNSAGRNPAGAQTVADDILKGML